MANQSKTLWVALVAVLAMGAIGVPAAGATRFTALSYPTGATAASPFGNNQFTSEAGSIACRSHYLFDDLNEPSEQMTMTTTTSECRAFGFLNAEVRMNGCDYVVHTSGITDLECPAGTSIEASASTCEVRVGTQTGLSKMDLSNGSGDIIGQATLTGIAYTVTKDGFGCPFNGTGAKTGATYSQETPITIQSTNGATIDIG
jgi:hypothetical protein